MLSAKNQFSKPILISFLILFMGFAVLFKPTPQYPNVELITPENVSISYLLNPTANAEDCHQILDALVNTFETACPTCRIQKQQCLQALTPQRQTQLSAAPLPYPSARMPNGVVTYIAPDANIALAACQQGGRQAAQGSGKVTCHAPNTSRPIPDSIKKGWANNLLVVLLTLAAAGAASWFICYLVIRYEHLHAHFSHDHTDAGPQKFHAIPTARIGGLGIFGGLLMGAGIVLILHPESSHSGDNFGYLLLAAIPAFIGGLVEDITKNVGVAQRLLLSMISAAIGAWLLGAVINRMDIPLLDNALLWLPFAVAVTVFAIGGVTNAINIIDGYNGLAGGFAVIVLIAMAAVAAQVNDNLILVVSVSMIGAMLGFLAWNWPKGKIFMGDGGAYLLGFILAELSVLLIYRNPGVSPWFPLLLLAYPVFETLFSIYRRKWLRNATPGQPDALHLHSLIYKRVIGGHLGTRCPHRMTRNNSRVAPHIWITASLSSLFAALFWHSTPMLMMASLAGCMLYIIVYRRLIQLRGLGWLARKR